MVNYLVGETAEQLDFQRVDLRVASNAVAMADWMTGFSRGRTVWLH